MQTAAVPGMQETQRVVIAGKTLPALHVAVMSLLLSASRFILCNKNIKIRTSP